MRLVNASTQQEVKVGDKLTFEGKEVEIIDAPKPHSPASSGKVSVKYADGSYGPTYYAQVFGLEWIEREDRR